MDHLKSLIDIILHVDRYLLQLSVDYGTFVYLIVFLILFCETGLVITPFLPGDSLLFALGAMTSMQTTGQAGASLDFTVLSGLLMLAVFLGDNVNYWVGRRLGETLFSNSSSRVFKKKYLIEAHSFYEKWGTRAVVIARFVPIVRTFVPFVAGIGEMPYRKYLLFSVAGSALWIQIFLWAGRLFGNLPAVKSNFHIVIFVVIGLSVAPIILAYLRAKKIGRP